MKKFIILFVIAFSLFVMKANAACPTGWNEVDFTYLYDSDNDGIGDCEVTVYYCHITLPTGEFRVKIDKITIKLPCGLSFINTAAFWDDVQVRVRKDFMEVVTFPPCPLLVFNVEIRRANCWAAKNVPYNPITNTQWHMEMVDCEMIGYCEWLYKICYNTLTGKNESSPPQKTEIPSELCSGTMPQMPPPGYTWNDLWTTECYGISCGE